VVKVEEILTVENSFPGRYFSMTASNALCLLSCHGELFAFCSSLAVELGLVVGII